MRKAHIVLILDKSGSMYNLERAIKDSFRTFVEDQQDERGEANLTVSLFSNYNTVLHNNIPFSQVSTYIDYRPNGGTAMYDSIVETLEPITDSDVFVVVQTDGEENSSSRSSSEVSNLIQDKQSKGWQFMFLGADKGLIESAKQIGLQDNCVLFNTTSQGIETAFSDITRAVSNFRCSLDTDIKTI